MRTKGGAVELKSGVAAGETVVVRGAEALRDGAPVRVIGAGETAGAPAPATAGSGT